MKFLKGMILGGIVTAGIAMMYTDSMEKSKRNMMRKGKQMVRKMGMM